MTSVGNPSSQDTLFQEIQDKTARVGIVGLGYVGLPLVHAFVQAGFRLLGYDVDQRKIEALAAGKSYIKHIPSQWIGQWIERKCFEATADLTRLAEADAILICVPTPLSDSRDPDLSYVQSTAQHIAQALRPGQLVVLESTTYPGTTRDVLLPILLQSGLRPGHDRLSELAAGARDGFRGRRRVRRVLHVDGGPGGRIDR